MSHRPETPHAGIRQSPTYKILNHLTQLQELIVARSQQEVSMPGARLTQLEENIQTLFAELPADIGLQFRRLEKKSPLVIIPITNGVCSACGMSLPVSLVHAVHAAERLFTCPSCARLLYYPEAMPRNLRKSPRRSEPAKIGLERFSAPGLMIPQLASTDREAVLQELSAKLESEGFVDDSTKLAETALRREAIVSTAVEYGLAFPHVRGIEGGGLTLALGLSKKGIKFNPQSRTLTRVVFFMVIPTAASAFYLKLLSGLSQTFQKEEAREKLFEADSPEKLWKALLRATKSIIQ